MKPGHGDETPIIGHFLRMKENSDGLTDEVKACRKLEMAAKIQEMKDRLGNRLIVNPTGQLADMKAIEQFLEREVRLSREPPEDMSS